MEEWKPKDVKALIAFHSKHGEPRVMDLRKELAEVINKWSLDNGSDTPDFVLAEFLESCLLAFDMATKQREARLHIDSVERNSNE